MTNSIIAGVSKVNITPQKELISGGYFSDDGHAERIHDNLFAKVLYLEKDQAKILLVVCDLLGLIANHVNTIRTAIQKQTGIDKNSIMITSIHTHSSPDSIEVFGRVDPKYIQVLAKKITKASSNALKNAEDCQIKVASGTSKDISHNRRIKMKDGTAQAEWWKPAPAEIAGFAGPVDSQLGAIKIDDSRGNTKALMINYACHPVITCSSKKYSADFPGYATKILEKELGGVSFFLNGACGDINPNVEKHTYKEAERLGKILANDALSILKHAQPIHSNELSIIKKSIKLKWRKWPSITEARKRVSEGKKNIAKLKKEDNIQRIEAFAGPDLRRKESVLNLLLSKVNKKEIISEIQLLKIGEIMLVTIPGELFTEIGIEIKNKSKYKNTFIVTNTNDYQGYIPTKKAYKEGGYEVTPMKISKLKPGTAEEIRDFILNLLEG